MWFVREARKMARRYGAAIAYIDEIDAVGASRGGVMGGRGGPGAGGGMGGISWLAHLFPPPRHRASAASHTGSLGGSAVITSGTLLTG